jgi:hypothetical protein
MRTLTQSCRLRFPREKRHAQRDQRFSIIIANLGGVLGLSGLLMLSYVFPSAVEQCPAWAKPLFQILAALDAIVVVGVLIQTADQISPVAWAFAASSPPHS